MQRWVSQLRAQLARGASLKAFADDPDGGADHRGAHDTPFGVTPTDSSSSSTGTTRRRFDVSRRVSSLTVVSILLRRSTSASCVDVLVRDGVVQEALVVYLRHAARSSGLRSEDALQRVTEVHFLSPRPGEHRDGGDVLLSRGRPRRR